LDERDLGPLGLVDPTPVEQRPRAVVLADGERWLADPRRGEGTFDIRLDADQPTRPHAANIGRGLTMVADFRRPNGAWLSRGDYCSTEAPVP
jgi:hypothetical protein